MDKDFFNKLKISKKLYHFSLSIFSNYHKKNLPTFIFHFIVYLLEVE